MNHDNCKDAAVVNGVRDCGHSALLCSVCTNPVFGGADCAKCIMAQVERSTFGIHQNGAPFAVDAWPNQDEREAQIYNG